MHTQRARQTRWDLSWVQLLINTYRASGVNSLIDVDLGGCKEYVAQVAKETLHELRLVYFTPDQTKQAGFLETDHFGVRFPSRTSHIDLTGIPQRWLRDLTWDYMADLLRSPRRLRTAGVFDRDALKAAYAEIATQRTRIGELLGQIRDLQAEWTEDAIARITTENTTLKQRVRQLTADKRRLDERLQAAHSNLRCQDRRVAQLEAQLLDQAAIAQD